MRQQWSFSPRARCCRPRYEERFGGLTIMAVTAHMPDQTGIAGFGLDPTSAFSALAARLRGELPVTDVCFPRPSSPHRPLITDVGAPFFAIFDHAPKEVAVASPRSGDQPS